MDHCYQEMSWDAGQPMPQAVGQVLEHVEGERNAVCPSTLLRRFLGCSNTPRRVSGCYARVAEMGNQWEAIRSIEMMKNRPMLQVVNYVLQFPEDERSAVRLSTPPHRSADYNNILRRAKGYHARVVETDNQWKVQTIAGVRSPQVYRWLRSSLAWAALSWARRQVALLVQGETSPPALHSVACAIHRWRISMPESKIKRKRSIAQVGICCLVVESGAVHSARRRSRSSERLHVLYLSSSHEMRGFNDT
jgi:hypothetical protein